MSQVNIIVSSQTGNSFSAAQYIRDKICQPCEIYNIENISLKSLLKESLLIFIISTHGNGDFPYSAQKYWTLLKNKNMPKIYEGKFFALFGLGDSNYVNFNYAAKKLFYRIKKLGGKELIPPFYGDDQDPMGIYTELYKWTDKLRNIFKNKSVFSSPLLIEKISPISAKILNMKFFANNTILEIKLALNIEKYTVGDVIGILPENYNNEEFGLHNKIKNTFFKYDINCIPSFYLISKLYEYVLQNSSSIFDGKRRENIIKKLNELVNDYDIYFEYIKRVKRTFFEVLKDFYIQVSYDFIKKNLNLIQKRFFTLQKVKNEYFILVSLVNYKNDLKNKRVGLVSEYLKNQKINNFINISKENSFLNFSKKKLLIICTGSGITVARACWSNLNMQMIIFYGFRKRNIDRVYAEEYSKIKNIHVIECPSREENKKYVQKIFYEKFTDNIEDFDILVAGGAYLNKEISSVLFKKFGKKIQFKTESW